MAIWVSTNGVTHALELHDAQTSERRVLGPGAGGLTSFSPDARHLVFARPSSDDPMRRDIYVADVETARINQLIAGPGDKSSPLWSADGKEIVYISRGTDTTGLWSQAVRDGQAIGDPRVINKNIGPAIPLGLTNRGSYYYTIEAQATDVYVARVNMADGVVLEPPRRIASSMGSTASPEWSPDGRFLAWQTITPPPGIVLRALDSPVERKLDVPLNVGYARWSPDGRSLLIRAGDRREAGLYVVDLATRARRGPFLRNQPFGDFEWEPHGRSALVLKFEKGVTRLNVESGKESQVYMPPLGWQLGRGIAISPDGRRLAVNLMREQESAIAVADFDHNRTLEVIKVMRPQIISAAEWTRDGRSLAYYRHRMLPTRTSDRNRQLWAVTVDTGVSRPLNITRENL